MDGATELIAVRRGTGDAVAFSLRLIRDPDGKSRGLALDGLDPAGATWIDSLSAWPVDGERAFVVAARPTADPDVWTARIDDAAGAGDSPPDRHSAADARLRELNHRVLNSLAMLSSIIGLESRAVGDGDGRAALERVRSRLVAVSNLYRILSAAGMGPTIRADHYLRGVAGAVSASVGSGDRIAVAVEAPPVELTTAQAAALGLITNEAMTNAYKHAFAGRSAGGIAVTLRDEPGRLVLTITDDGVGTTESARSGLGTTLMGALAIDLAGEVRTVSGSGGTTVRVDFPRAG
jgi:two-component sensor histidine kinase